MSIQETGTFKIEHGRKYLLKSFPMFHEDVITGSSPGGSVGLVNMPSDRRVAFTLTTKVYLIFTDDRLRYWGLLEELQKSEDTEIQEIARYIFPY
jgi:hypothetical protein